MVMVHLHLLIILNLSNIKVNGKMMLQMEKELCILKMEQNMKEIFIDGICLDMAKRIM